MRLIKPAIHDTGILRMVVLRQYGADRPGRRHGRRLHTGRFLRAILHHRFCWLLRTGRIERLRLSLAMRDELGIAGRSRPWRHIIGQATSPMRPMIGDKAAAACEIKPKPEHNSRFNEPLMGHIRCRISRLTQVSLPQASFRLTSSRMGGVYRLISASMRNISIASLSSARSPRRSGSR
jgi:hypothetical protein